MRDVPVRPVPSPTAVDAGGWWRWLLALAAALILTMVGGAAWQYAQFTRARADVEQSEAVALAADRVLTVLVDAETGYRGYLLTGNAAFLEPYRGVDKASREALLSLTSLLGSDPARRPTLLRLTELVDARLAEMRGNLALYDAGRAAEAYALIRLAHGKRLMDEIRVIAARLKSDQRKAADISTQQADAAAAWTRALSAGAIVSMLLIAFAGLSVRRSMEERRRALANETIARLEAERNAEARKAELGRNERFTRSLLASSPDCILEVTASGELAFVNEAAERVFGVQPGSVAFERLWPENVAAASEALRSASLGTPARFVAGRAEQDGTLRWWDVLVAPVKEPDGSVLRSVATARDVTLQRRQDEERQQLLASERAARSSAERAARLKDDFVTTLSHELRTPLNAIIGWVGVLRHDQGPETINKGLAVIDRNTRRQAHIIDDLLDMGRILSGKMRLDVQRIELATIIEDVLVSAQPTADAKNIRLLTALGSAAIVRGDAGRLQQVIWNLLSNAIKFTPRGGQVQVTLRKVNSHVHLQVSDTGMGIAPEQLETIFERFRQVDGSTTRRQGGLGLGLSIVRSLVELHGGTVEATSEGENAGTTFTVRLPLALAVPAPEVEAVDDSVPPQLRHSLTGMHVLVVEDEDDAREIVVRLLSDAGASVTAVPSAGDALGLLADSLRPDVIVSDVGMPECDGYEFISRVRALPSTAQLVPAVALTALARVEDRRRALLSGFQTHLAKPVDPAELVAAVAAVAVRTGRPEDGAPSAPAS